MDDCFGARTVIIISLNDGGAIGGLSLFDHRCTIPIPFTIVVSVTLADGHADANRTYAYSDFLGQRATSKRQCRPIVRNFCKDTGSDIICV